ncbi:MAG: aromatic acid exporter family protein [Lawsonibacter sp.]|jgi:uncharacterized membrane protein YgaE (UPF0421/DUF939 family)
MRLRSWKSPVGPRILKTALAVTLALAVVEPYGASPAKVVFATIGAMSAVAPTFTASLLACLTQICGVAVGGLLALTVIALRIPPVIGVGVGIIGILTGYQYFRLKLVPVLPCLVLVNICLNPAVEGASYAAGRLWDTAIGLAIGMAVNLLIFPYDNSRKIRRTMEGLDRDLILFLEDLFDGDEHLPEAVALARKVDALEGQLLLFAQQRLLLHRRQQKQELQRLRSCEDIARELVVEMEALRNMERRGHLNRENRQELRALGAQVMEEVPDKGEQVEDVVVNYHVARALSLRRELRQSLPMERREKRSGVR